MAEAHNIIWYQLRKCKCHLQGAGEELHRGKNRIHGRLCSSTENDAPDLKYRFATWRQVLSKDPAVAQAAPGHRFLSWQRPVKKRRVFGNALSPHW
jgi:hypothetical protein